MMLDGRGRFTNQEIELFLGAAAFKVGNKMKNFHALTSCALTRGAASSNGAQPSVGRNVRTKSEKDAGCNASVS